MIKILILILLSSLSAVPVFAEPTRRALELELEEIPNTTGYEIRVVRIISGSRKKPAIFKIKKNIWAANLVPGKYEMSVRSMDVRGVGGEWGPTQELVVKTPAPVIRSPITGFQIKSSDNSREKIKFTWDKVEGADKYKIKITDKNKKVIEEKVTEENEMEFKLSAAHIYEWNVTSIFEGDLEGDSSPTQKMEIIGAVLETPAGRSLEEFNTQVISWKKVDDAQKYDFLLEKKSENGQWKEVDKKVVDQLGRRYTQPLPTGEYRMKVKAIAESRQDSETFVREFKTRRFDGRSIAAIEQIKAEATYESRSNLFAIASYYITIVNYAGRNIDYNTVTRYSPVGGTGRVGLGAWFKEDGPFGILGVADLSGYKIQDVNYTYPSIDLLGVYRTRLGSLGQLRVNMGGRFRELPVTVGDANNFTLYTQSKVSNIGPVLNLNLAHGFQRKFGVQANAGIYSSMMGTYIPNGKANVNKISYQFGLLGSMKLAEGLVGFAGYSYRIESASFENDPAAVAASSGSNSTEANVMEINGHYLNLMLEYGF